MGNEGKFIVQNHLNHEAIFGGSYCDPKRRIDKCNGYLNSDYSCIGRAFLTFCYSKIFNIHRLYGYEDGFLQDYRNQSDVEHAFATITESELVEAIEELMNMYLATQRYLEAESDRGYISVIRALRPFEINQIVDQLEDGNEEILLKTNTITSYACDGQAFGYGTAVSIRRKISIADVVMHYKVLAYPEDSCRFSPMHGGEYEVWVKNESPLGLLKLSKQEVEVFRERYEQDYLDEYRKRKDWNDNSYIRYSYEQSMKKPLSKEPDPSKLYPPFSRPCIDDPMVRFIMKLKKYL